MIDPPPSRPPPPAPSRARRGAPAALVAALLLLGPACGRDDDASPAEASLAAAPSAGTPHDGTGRAGAGAPAPGAPRTPRTDRVVGGADGVHEEAAAAGMPANELAYDFPALATLSNKDVWVSQVHWDGTGDTVELALLTDLSGHVVPVHASDTHVLGTALAADAGDVLHVVWCEQVAEDGRWELRGAEVSVPARALSAADGAAPPAANGEAPAGGPAASDAADPDGAVWRAEVSPPVTLAGGPGRRALLPRLCADGEGRLLLVWMEIDGGQLAVRARVREPASRAWSDAVDVARGDSAWFPGATAIAPGRFAVVWDAAVDGDYDVHLARLGVLDGRPAVEEVVRVTDSPRYEAHASVAAAGERLYVAYEVAQEQWGREGSVNRLDHALHDVRTLEIVALEGGTVAPLAEPFMDGISPSLRQGCERPSLLVDGGGNLVLFFRGMPLPDEMQDPDNPEYRQFVEERAGAGAGWRSAIWFTYVSRWDGRAWFFAGRHQMGLPGSNGRSDAPFAVAHLAGGGVAYAVVGDGREREAARTGNQIVAKDQLNWWCPISAEPTRITTGRIARGAPVRSLPLGEARPLPAPRPPQPAPARARPARTLADGTAVTLALGDLHRHTDLSRCSSNWDGPFSDAVRYAFDVGPLQFLAVTDHFEHMTAYDWWRSLAQMDAFHAPGRMVNLRAYERADALTGHRNVISADGQVPLVGYRRTYDAGRDDARADAPAQMWQHFASEQVLTIPHTPAGMFHASQAVLDWLSFNPAYDRVVEVFQGYRGSSEAEDAPRAIASQHPRRFVRPALDGGLHFGFVASSDHQSSHGAFAGAWVTGLSRREVFDALHARATFASTVPLALWAEWDGVPMGESRRRESGPTAGLVVEVQPLGEVLERVELIVDGAVLATLPARAAEPAGDGWLRFTFSGPALDVPAQGTRYAYARVRTASGELGWTSPVRLGGADWTGPDGPHGSQAFDEATGKALQHGPLGARWVGPAGEVDLSAPAAEWSDDDAGLDPETGAPLRDGER